MASVKAPEVVRKVALKWAGAVSLQQFTGSSKGWAQAAEAEAVLRESARREARSISYARV